MKSRLVETDLDAMNPLPDILIVSIVYYIYFLLDNSIPEDYRPKNPLAVCVGFNGELNESEVLKTLHKHKYNLDLIGHGFDKDRPNFTTRDSTFDYMVLGNHADASLEKPWQKSLKEANKRPDFVLACRPHFKDNQTWLDVYAQAYEHSEDNALIITISQGTEKHPQDIVDQMMVSQMFEQESGKKIDHVLFDAKYLRFIVSYFIKK